MTPELFVAHYPKLYHMAEADTWESIKQKGLFSTTALLDLFEIKGKERRDIESKRRPERVTLSHPKHGTIIIRDNKPITEKKLKKWLNGMTPKQWFITLNNKVFFWSLKERLLTLLNARAYRNSRHTILTVDSKALLKHYIKHIHLAPINTGAMPFGGSPRGLQTFKKMIDWPANVGPRSGKLKVPIVEVAASYHVPDIAKFTLRVDEMQGDQKLRTIWKR